MALDKIRGKRFCLPPSRHSDYEAAMATLIHLRPLPMHPKLFFVASRPLGSRYAGLVSVPFVACSIARWRAQREEAGLERAARQRRPVPERWQHRFGLR
jgi:hypothetical protein